MNSGSARRARPGPGRGRRARSASVRSAASAEHQQLERPVHERALAGRRRRRLGEPVEVGELERERAALERRERRSATALVGSPTPMRPRVLRGWDKDAVLGRTAYRAGTARHGRRALRPPCARGRRAGERARGDLDDEAPGQPEQVPTRVGVPPASGCRSASDRCRTRRRRSAVPGTPRSTCSGPSPVSTGNCRPAPGARPRSRTRAVRSFPSAVGVAQLARSSTPERGRPRDAAPAPAARRAIAADRG